MAATDTKDRTNASQAATPEVPISTAVAIRAASDVPRVEIERLAREYLTHRAPNNKTPGLFEHDLTAVQAKELAQIAVAYGLDPLLGELTVYEGKPLVTLDGRLRQANREDAFDGIEDPVAASDEQRKAFRCADNEDLWVARVWRKDRRFPFTAIGRANGPYERNYIVKNQGRGPDMAYKRALVRALRMAFSLPLPGEHDEIGTVEVPSYVRAGSGEIIDIDASPPPIRDDQTKAIHAIARSIGWITGSGDTYDDGPYREMLMDTFEKDTSQDLTEADASAIIDLLSAEQERVLEARAEADAAAKHEETQAEIKKAGGGKAIINRMAEDEYERPSDGDKQAYAALINMAGRLPIDLAPFETTGKESRHELERLADKLNAKINEATGAQQALPTE